MPIIFEPILSIFIVIGFYFIGRFISLKLQFDKILSFVSNPHYQFTIIGIVFFLYFIFPFFLLGVLPKEIFYLFYLVSFYGLLNILINYKKIYSSANKITQILKQTNKSNLFILSILFMYFLLSLAPPTSGDSLFYHLSDAKKIFLNGTIYSNELNFHGKLSGIGEFFNAFAVSIEAYQFTSLIHFVGLLSTIGIIRKFSVDQKIKESNINFIILIVLSTPVLLSLVSQSKPQLFYSSVVFLCYSFILFLIIRIREKKFNNIGKIIIISNILLTVCVNAKLNFLLSFGIINSFYIFYFINKGFQYKINFQKTFYYFLIIIFGLLPFIIWKSFVYDYPFYLFLTNPLPLNIPHMADFFEFLKNYGSEKFPWIIFFPINLGDISLVLGLGVFLLLFIIKSKLQFKKTILFIIIFFIISLSILGQKSPRFYYEIYLFIILVSTLIFNDIIKEKYFSYFKILIYIQSFCIIFALIFSTLFLFPGSLNAKLKHQVQSKFADGYSLIFWVNSLLPKDVTVLITQRSTFLFNNSYINPEPLGYMSYDSKYKNYYLNKIKEKKPTFVIFHGNKISYNIGKFDFKNCISGLFAKELNVGSLKTRNPLNSSKNLYNGYIYYFDYKKLPNCVQRANIEN
tara:strand:- start:199 stop:2082 length:1884 start_codon:yes stop_codon:yes gene_type:complete